MVVEIVGRERELAAIDAFLTAAPPGAIILAGDPGSGKTTLIEHACDLAVQAGMTAMVVHPGRHEVGLAYAALTDLFDGSFNELRPNRGGAAPRVGGCHESGVASPLPSPSARSRLGCD